MAWRPTEYLIEGELDNTTPGKVTGWMRFAGMDENVTFDLKGNFHRDIRGAKIHIKGDGVESEEARGFMEGFDPRQVGDVGDMTAGLPPADYIAGAVYLEWYSHSNGRVVIELDQDQLQVIGTPIPACESDPISRAEQARHMANFLHSVSQEIGAPAISVGSEPTLVSDPSFTHWVIVDGQIIGEAHSVEPAHRGVCFAYVRLFGMPENAEYGDLPASQLQPKNSRSTPQ